MVLRASRLHATQGGWNIPFLSALRLGHGMKHGASPAASTSLNGLVQVLDVALAKNTATSPSTAATPSEDNDVKVVSVDVSTVSAQSVSVEHTDEARQRTSQRTKVGDVTSGDASWWEHWASSPSRQSRSSDSAQKRRAVPPPLYDRDESTHLAAVSAQSSPSLVTAAALPTAPTAPSAPSTPPAPSSSLRLDEHRQGREPKSCPSRNKSSRSNTRASEAGAFSHRTTSTGASRQASNSEQTHQGTPRKTAAGDTQTRLKPSLREVTQSQRDAVGSLLGAHAALLSASTSWLKATPATLLAVVTAFRISRAPPDVRMTAALQPAVAAMAGLYSEEELCSLVCALHGTRVVLTGDTVAHLVSAVLGHWSEKQKETVTDAETSNWRQSSPYTAADAAAASVPGAAGGGEWKNNTRQEQSTAAAAAGARGRRGGEWRARQETPTKAVTAATVYALCMQHAACVNRLGLTAAYAATPEDVAQLLEHFTRRRWGEVPGVSSDDTSASEVSEGSSFSSKAQYSRRGSSGCDHPSGSSNMAPSGSTCAEPHGNCADLGQDLDELLMLLEATTAIVGLYDTATSPTVSSEAACRQVLAASHKLQSIVLKELLQLCFTRRSDANHSASRDAVPRHSVGSVMRSVDACVAVLNVLPPLLRLAASDRLLQHGSVHPPRASYDHRLAALDRLISHVDQRSVDQLFISEERTSYAALRDEVACLARRVLEDTKAHAVPLLLPQVSLHAMSMARLSAALHRAEQASPSPVTTSGTSSSNRAVSRKSTALTTASTSEVATPKASPAAGQPAKGGLAGRRGGLGGSALGGILKNIHKNATATKSPQPSSLPPARSNVQGHQSEVSVGDASHSVPAMSATFKGSQETVLLPVLAAALDRSIEAATDTDGTAGAPRDQEVVSDFSTLRSGRLSIDAALCAIKREVGTAPAAAAAWATLAQASLDAGIASDGFTFGQATYALLSVARSRRKATDLIREELGLAPITNQRYDPFARTNTSPSVSNPSSPNVGDRRHTREHDGPVLRSETFVLSDATCRDDIAADVRGDATVTRHRQRSLVADAALATLYSQCPSWSAPARPSAPTSSGHMAASRAASFKGPSAQEAPQSIHRCANSVSVSVRTVSSASALSTCAESVDTASMRPAVRSNPQALSAGTADPRQSTSRTQNSSSVAKPQPPAHLVADLAAALRAVAVLVAEDGGAPVSPVVRALTAALRQCGVGDRYLDPAMAAAFLERRHPRRTPTPTSPTTNIGPECQQSNVKNSDRPATRNTSDHAPVDAKAAAFPAVRLSVRVGRVELAVHVATSAVMLGQYEVLR